MLYDAQRMLVVAETACTALAQQLVERVLARMPERRMTEVVTQPDRLDEILVEAQCPRNAPRDSGRLEGVRQPGAKVVALGVDEDLRLVAEAPERLRVDDPVAVALERRAQSAILFVVRAGTRLVGANGERGQPAFLVLTHESFEAVSD